MSLRVYGWVLNVGVFLALAVVLFGLGRCTAPTPAPAYSEVRVDTVEIRGVERVDTFIDWKERIQYRTAEPTVAAVADSGGVADVASFCAESIERAVRDARADSVPAGGVAPAAAPSLLLRSARVDPGWFFAADELVLTGPRSDGSLWQGTYSVRDGWQAHVRGPEVLVQSPRAALLRELLEAAVYAGAGYGLGYLHAELSD